MKKAKQLECNFYIPPQADIIYVNCRNVLCQSNEAPDLTEGWLLEL